MEIKASIFDLGDVILDVSHREYFGLLLSQSRTIKTVPALMSRLSQPKIRSMFDLYQIGKEPEGGYWENLLDSLDVDPTLEAVETAKRCAFGTIQGVNQDMINFIQDLKRRGLLTFVLSNMIPETEAASRTALVPYSELFDGLYFSSSIGLRKPDEKAYRHVLENNGLKPGECVFIDDRLKNVDVANVVGIHGIHYKGSVDDLKRDLYLILE